MNKADLNHDEFANLWHPFTQMQTWAEDDPLIIVEGSGVKLIDIDDNEYYDANSSLWVNIHGHRRSEIDEAIVCQLGRVAHSTMLGLTHPLAVELAARLVDIAPHGLSRVFYSDSGSEAVEIALKMAFQYWRHRQQKRSKFVALGSGYHGDTVGSVSVGGISLFHGIFRDLLFDAEFVPSPYSFPDADSALAPVKDELIRNAGKIAALIAEPLVQGAAGMLVAPTGYLSGLRKLCTEHDVLLIVDEVATGFGRTGTMFACEQEGVSPDLMCVAKGITGGYLPLAATMTTEEVFSAFLGGPADGKTFYHGHSYTGNPLGCAAALASLDIFEKDGTLEHVREVSAIAKCELERFERLTHVGEIRQKGLMVGIELYDDVAGRCPYPPAATMGARVCRRARTMGLITRPLGDVIVFLPPLVSTATQVVEMLAIIENAIQMETDA